MTHVNIAKLILGLAVGLALSAPVVAKTKAGATGNFQQNGQPTSGTVVLPDCRSCTVKQTGRNQYEVKIPNDVRAKSGMPPAKDSKAK